MAQLLQDFERRVTSLERRRNSDGVVNPLTGECGSGGGSGGDTSYYGGGTDYPYGEFPTDSWNTGGGGGAYTEGANIDIEGSVIHFAVDMTEPTSPRVGQVWLGP